MKTTKELLGGHRPPPRSAETYSALMSLVSHQTKPKKGRWRDENSHI